MRRISSSRSRRLRLAPAIVAAGAMSVAGPASAAPTTAHFDGRTAVRCTPSANASGPYAKGYDDYLSLNGTAPQYIDPADLNGFALTGLQVSVPTLSYMLGDEVRWIAPEITSLRVAAGHSTPASRELIGFPVSLGQQEYVGADPGIRKALVNNAGPYALDGASRAPVPLSIASMTVTAKGTATKDGPPLQTVTVTCTAGTDGRLEESPIVSIPVVEDSGAVIGVAGVAPDGGGTGGGKEITITGPGVGAATRVTFGAEPATGLRRIDDSTLAVTSPQHAAGAVNVAVTSPVGTSTTSQNSSFTYRAPAVRVSPYGAYYGFADRPNAALEISGNDLEGVRTVLFGSTPVSVTRTNLPYSLTVTAPPGARGFRDLRLLTPDATSENTPVDDFEYRVGTNDGRTGLAGGLDPDGGALITLSGLDLTHAVAVRIDGKPTTDFERLSPTSVRARTPIDTSSGRVSVLFDDGTPETGVGDDARTQFSWDFFTSIVDLAPSSGPATGGTQVVITGGTNINQVSGVTFGGVAATSWTRTGPKEIRATAPPATTPGEVPVVLKGGYREGGIPQDSNAKTFTYTAPTTPPAPAKITGLYPRTQKAKASGLALIVGTKLSGTKYVSFGGKRVRPLLVSPGAILVVTPALPAGSYPVTLVSTNWATDPATAPKLTYR